MALWAESNFGAPLFEPELLWKQIYCIDKSSLLVTLLELLGAFRNDSALGNCVPLPHLLLCR